MAWQVEIHPEALAEADAALDWYAERSSRAPAAFLKEIDKAIKPPQHAKTARAGDPGQIDPGLPEALAGF